MDHLTRGLTGAKAGVAGLVREYERLGRAASAAGRAMDHAKPRHNRETLLTSGGAVNRNRAFDLATAQRGTRSCPAQPWPGTLQVFTRTNGQE